MSSTHAVTLQLTARSVEAYCRELARRSPTPEKRVAALDALITFISTQVDSGEQAKAEFVAIRQTLLDHVDQAREALLDERGQRLQRALQARDLPDITVLYTSLSRDAFWGLLGRVEQQFDAAALNSLRSWVSAWLAQARQRGQQASPYPDAIDFKAAGIDVSAYLAMTALHAVTREQATRHRTAADTQRQVPDTACCRPGLSPRALRNRRSLLTPETAPTINAGDGQTFVPDGRYQYLIRISGCTLPSIRSPRLSVIV